MDKAKLATKKDYSNIGEAIDHELAAKMVKDFHDSHPDVQIAFNVGRKIIEQILAQPSCVAMRFFNAINEEGKHTLVYSGVDENGNTIFNYSVVGEDGKLGKVDALIGDRSNGWSWLE
ncbi:MAG TPA: hypothetical protein VMI12_16250 [Puia sp.]|nr:hypothetical protein [Puia sp.]